MESLPFSALSQLAKIGRWLFWTSALYVLLWVYRDALISGLAPMNPSARSTAWGQFMWFFPSNATLICMLVLLGLLFLFQFHLRKGCADNDAGRVVLGLRCLHWLLGAAAVLIAFRGISWVVY